jgi:hypothetical protein
LLIFKKLIPNSQLIKIQLFRSLSLINSELLISFTASTFSIVYKNYKYGQYSGLQKYFLFLNLQTLVSLILKINTKILKAKKNAFIRKMIQFMTKNSHFVKSASLTYQFSKLNALTLLSF